MITKRILNRMKSTQHSYEYIRHSIFNSTLPESVYFYTFHKCASTLFSNYVLKNIDGLHNVDYASQIYLGRRSARKELTFKEKGFIYGPIRISADEKGPVGKTLVKPTIEHDFVRDKIALFFVRDPRDILVSSYYSFGFTHGLSKVPAVRERQVARRQVACELTLDEYALQSVERQIKLFSILYDLSNACERSKILRYEDMIDDFDTFAEQLRRYVSVSDAVIQGCYERTRPKMTEDMTAHRRSGQVQGFRNKLEEDTIRTLNRKLENILSAFGYEA